MPGSVIWRCIRHLVVLIPVALFTGHAAGEAPTQCTNLPAASAPPSHLAADRTPAVPSALETQIWKTITVGGYKGVNALREAMETAPCPIWIGDWADEVLGRPAFPFNKTPFEVDLVVLAVFELGFGHQGSLNDIHARAITLGFELCPAEVGPALRLGYMDQPLGEFLHIAMTPVARYDGELVDFTVANGGAGLLLVGGNGHPDVVMPAAARFVFVRPKPIARR
jgi:hypothetical protein